MSWDATLACGECGSGVHQVNYTHNMNRAIRKALELRQHTLNWYEDFDGLIGAESVDPLDDVIAELEQHPEDYRHFEPPNGWGSIDSLLSVLRAMRDAGIRHPNATWTISG